MLCLSLAAAVAAILPASGAAQLSALADIDRDGLITVAELQAAMADNAPRAVEMFHASKDENRDGHVSAAELDSDFFRRNVGMPILWSFVEADTDRDGKVTLDELRKEAMPEITAVLPQYMEVADRDRDGALSESEWNATRPSVTRSGGAP